MSKLTTEIKNLIIKKRSHLSPQSVKTYTSILSNLYKNIFGLDYDESNFEDTKKILNYLHELEPNKRKTILSALVIITDKESYRKQMLEDIGDYNKEQSLQVKSEKQNDSWLSNDEIKFLYNRLEKNFKAIMKKESYSMKDLQEIQNYIIISLLGGIFIPPRRSKDYVEFKINNIDKDKDNYLYKNKMVFNSYKTAKTYGQQILEIPKQLLKILKIWMEINPTEYLLFDSNENQLSNVKLNQRLNQIFDKKASVNQLRHTYLSDKYQHTIEENKKMAQDFKNMGSSMGQQKIYIKSKDV
jgi:integrase